MICVIIGYFNHFVSVTYLLTYLHVFQRTLRFNFRSTLKEDIILEIFFIELNLLQIFHANNNNIIDSL